MPQCRNCHREISKFDKDICPYCGCERPIDDNYKTKDMTQFVDPVTGNYKLYKSKNRKTAGLLGIFLGAFGAPQFYLGFRKNALIILASSVLSIALVGSLLFFFASFSFYGYLATYGVFFLTYALASIRYFSSDTLKDANGEFLR